MTVTNQYDLKLDEMKCITKNVNNRELKPPEQMCAAAGIESYDEYGNG